MHVPKPTSWRCPSCTSYNLTRRAFTSSTTHLNAQIPPENPKYIDFPTPPQRQEVKKPYIKGILPVPRDIFHRRRGGLDKASAAHIALSTSDHATPSSSNDTAHVPPADVARNDWKVRMAVRRKANLREGLQALADRRRSTDTKLAARTGVKQAERQALLDAAEREDERLTNPTVTALMKSRPRGGNSRAILPDPDRAERVAAMAGRVAAKEAARVDERQEALHSLYMRAQDFIINEQQLDAQINKVFGTATAPVVFGARGSSVWANGTPPSLRDLAKKANSTGQGGNDVSERTVNRLRRMAEELTGGKMAS